MNVSQLLFKNLDNESEGYNFVAKLTLYISP